jgi:hypothetical protein
MLGDGNSLRLCFCIAVLSLADKMAADRFDTALRKEQ